MLFTLSAVGLVLLVLGIWLILLGILNPRRIRQELQDILEEGDTHAATRQLHELMNREGFRQPYGIPTPVYVYWVRRNSAVKDQGRASVGVILAIVGVFCLLRGLGIL